MKKVAQMIHCSQGNLSHTRLLLLVTYALAVIFLLLEAALQMYRGGDVLTWRSMGTLLGLFLFNVLDRMNARNIEVKFNLREGASFKAVSEPREGSRQDGGRTDRPSSEEEKDDG